MENKSIWFKNLKEKELPKLNENKKVDVLIIGGGMTGITTAYHLKDSGFKVCVLEKEKVGHGVTARSTAKITFMQELIYEKMLKIFSYKTVSLYLKSQIEAMNIIEKTIKENRIKCDYEKVDSYVFTNQEKEIPKIKKEKDFLETAGLKIYEYKKVPFNLNSKYAIKAENTAVFNPVKYLSQLKEICIDYGVEIYENTTVLGVEKIRDKYVCFTNKNKIIADKVVIACHYPFFTFPFVMPVKGYLERSYICALETKKPLKISAITPNSEIKSLRYYQNKYLIYLTGSHDLCNKSNVEKNFNYLFKEAKQLETDIKYYWSNVDIITSDYLPYIGRINQNHPNMFIGTGYNTWGMTNGTIAGKIISDLILDRKNRYTEIFNPKRSFNLLKLIHIPINIYSSTKSYIETKIFKNRSFYSNNVVFKKEDGKNIAIYTDENGVEHKVYNRCPHLTCSLIFNEKEKTWDCPCHSSRFDIDGKCIKGPSRYDISYKKKDVNS